MARLTVAAPTPGGLGETVRSIPISGISLLLPRWQADSAMSRIRTPVAKRKFLVKLMDISFLSFTIFAVRNRNLVFNLKGPSLAPEARLLIG
jgi:hypothetical protein